MKQYTLFICILLLFAGCYPYTGESYYIGDLLSSGSSGQGGSMARFALSGDHLYIVDNTSLRTFDVSRAEAPKYLEGRDQYMDFGVETIFPMDTLLFLGSQTGMYIYNIARPAYPQPLSQVSHITACDPVVASGSYAYVTLNSDNIRCGRSVNELQVYDLSDLYNPRLVHTERAFKHPKGLGIDQHKLFVCDDGLKVYDLSNPARPIRIDDITDIPGAQGMDSYDVIPLNGLLMLIGSKGLFQFDYTGDKLSFLSKIEVSSTQ
jgi:hypothetical protein